MCAPSQETVIIIVSPQSASKACHSGETALTKAANVLSYLLDISVFLTAYAAQRPVYINSWQLKTAVLNLE